MPTLHQDSDDTAVVGKIKEVLEQRIGSDRFGLWFGNRVEFRYQANELRLLVAGDFALQRLRTHYLRAIESAASEVLLRCVPVRLMLQADDAAMLANLAEAAAAVEADDFSGQSDFAGRIATGQPITDEPVAAVAGKSSVPKSRAPQSQRERGAEHCGPAPVGQWLAGATGESRYARRPRTASPSQTRSLMTAIPPRNDAKTAKPLVRKTQRASIRVTADPEQTVGDPCANHGTVAANGSPRGNHAAAAIPAAPSASQAGVSSKLGRTNDVMTFGNFVTSTSNTLAVTAAKMLSASPAGAAPLCFWGATGTGKTHLLSAIRHELRARHQMARVLLMSAEDFTNDFLSCVRGTGLPAFRKRYRDVDALLIDNVQFLSGKNATLREMLYTVDTVLSRRRPLILAADRQPLEIDGLSADLAGRMSSGLVCGINPMELDLRRELFRRSAQQSYLPWDDQTIEMLAQRATGDGRVIQGISQLVSMLQRMYRRMPTLQEITTHAGDLLQRGPKVVALADVEKAICTAFGLSTSELRSNSKSRSVSQPRILAMYLSRQHTTAAFSEIGRYYGDRNHSTVIAAHRRVEDWIKGDQSVGGRGPKNMKVQEAIAAVENLLRIG